MSSIEIIDNFISWNELEKVAAKIEKAYGNDDIGSVLLSV